MRMKMVYDRTLAEVANEFLALKKVQKVRERTMNDCQKYIDRFLWTFLKMKQFADVSRI